MPTWSHGTPTLDAPRLWLGPHTLANAPRIHRWQNDPELLRLNSDRVTTETEDETHQALLRWMDASHTDIIHLAIYRGTDRALIGFAQIAMIDLYHLRCKVGITLGERDAWGQGYGTEALRRMVQHCFDSLGLNRVGAEVYAFNTRSIRMFERVGFRREGVLREHVYKGGYVNEIQYGLLRSDLVPSLHHGP